MARLPQISRDDLPSEGHSAWDSIVRSRGAVGGPFQVLMRVPPLAERVADVGTYLRFQGGLIPVERELAILTVARYVGSRFEWVAHRAVAEREGARTDAIEAIRTLGDVASLTERERLIVHTVRAILRDHTLDERDYGAAIAGFGEAGLVEMVGLIGFYVQIGLTLTVFQVEPPMDGPPPF
ncbi:MAG: hypothetical protein FJ033_14760 [Chloroflexi bacterium]|nr:hypothetical protein [Chloroflexota bacterium]